MANVTLWGASYSDVPAVTLPQTGGGTVTFYENGGGGSVEVEQKDVNFYDYDGTLLHAYTAEEFLALAEFPSNPTHEGLTAQGWNWTLAGAKTYVTKYGYLQIGQTYEPTDGNTHIHIQLDSTNVLSMTVYCPVGWVDWGDGSEQETVASNGNKNHTYAMTGSYIIRIHGNAAHNVDVPSQPSRLFVKEINLSKDVQNPTSNQLMDLYNLERITIPNGGMTADAVNYLRAPMRLTGLVLPRDFLSLTQLGSDKGYSIKAICLNEGLSGSCRVPGGMMSVKTITVPTGVTEFGDASGNGDFVWHLKTMIISDTVTSIKPRFTRVFSLKMLHMPPSLQNQTNVEFPGQAHSLPEVVVPDGTVSLLGGFTEIYSCKKITIGSDVTNLGNQTFMDSYVLEEIHMKPTTPPTRSVYNFRNKPSNCVIYVPYSADHSVLAAYQSATNWANDAALMQEEPQ